MAFSLGSSLPDCPVWWLSLDPASQCRIAGLQLWHREKSRPVSLCASYQSEGTQLVARRGPRLAFPSPPDTHRTSASWRSSGYRSRADCASWQPHNTRGRARSRRLTPVTIAASCGLLVVSCARLPRMPACRGPRADLPAPGEPCSSAGRGRPAPAMPARRSAGRRTERAEGRECRALPHPPARQLAQDSSALCAASPGACCHSPPWSRSLQEGPERIGLLVLQLPRTSVKKDPGLRRAGLVVSVR